MTMFRTTTMILTTTIFAAAASAAPSTSGLIGATEVKAEPLGAAPASSTSTTKVNERGTVSPEIKAKRDVADLNGDGRVSQQDMYDFLQNWNERMDKGVGSMQEYYNYLAAFHAATRPATSSK
jgi:hypothetical protein